MDIDASAAALEGVSVALLTFVAEVWLAESAAMSAMAPANDDDVSEVPPPELATLETA